MTDYNNLWRDFPDRLNRLAQKLDRPAKDLKLEVTFSLAIAAAAIVVPLDRLALDPRGKPNAFGDREKLPKATIKRFDEVLNSKFLSSPVWPATGSGSWFYGEIPSSWAQDHVEKWLAKARPIQNEETCRDVMYIIRHALAHGNTRVHANENQKIRKIVFPAFIKTLRFVTVTRDDLMRLVHHWVAFLNTLELSFGIENEKPSARTWKMSDDAIMISSP